VQRLGRPVFTASEAVLRLERTSLRPSFARSSGLISLAMGEPDFDTPPEIVEAAVAALRGGHTRYTDPFGEPELRDALATVVSRVAGAPFSRDQLLITHGSSAGVAAAIRAIVNPGDRVVIPEPSYSLYADVVQLVGGIPVFVALRSDYHFDLERLAPALAGARLLVLCSPGNPTGAVYRADEWAKLVDLVADTPTLVLADEAYHSLVYDDRPFVSGLQQSALRDQLVYAQTFSKAYAMTGWRIGYLAGPAEIVRAAGLIHRTFNGTNNAFVQRAALVALEDGGAYALPWLEQFAQRRAFAVERLQAIDGLTVHAPEGGFYVFARYATPVLSTELAARMHAAGVAVRAGREYGPSGERHFRISFATSLENLATGIERIAGVFRELALTR
jgi:aspartate aminotransferase